MADDGQTERARWTLVEKREEKVVLRDAEGTTDWVLPAGIMPEGAEVGDELEVVAELIRPDAPDGSMPAALEEATGHLQAGVLDDYKRGDPDPI